MELLYQEKPRVKSTYTRHKNRSFRDSIESNQNGAVKETMILRWNQRAPTSEIILHLLEVFTAKDINAFRKKVFRYLKDHRVQAVASIELTRGQYGTPNNKVHFHCITDNQCSEHELRDLFNTACLRAGLNSEDFRVDYRPLWNGYLYFNYFTKYRYPEKVILFRKDMGLQKFYQIGKWFTKSKKQIWDEIKAYMKEIYGTHPDKIDELPVELIGEDLEVEQDRTLDWYESSPYYLPVENVRDRRYEWRRRFGHSIAVLQ